MTGSEAMIVPISQEINVTASFFFSHSRHHTLRLSVFCVSSQINGLCRGAGDRCFPRRFTELISAAACCQHSRCGAISPGAVLYLFHFLSSSSTLSLSLWEEEETGRNRDLSPVTRSSHTEKHNLTVIWTKSFLLQRCMSFTDIQYVCTISIDLAPKTSAD